MTVCSACSGKSRNSTLCVHCGAALAEGHGQEVHLSSPSDRGVFPASSPAAVRSVKAAMRFTVIGIVCVTPLVLVSLVDPDWVPDLVLGLLFGGAGLIGGIAAPTAWLSAATKEAEKGSKPRAFAFFLVAAALGFMGLFFLLLVALSLG